MKWTSSPLFLFSPFCSSVSNVKLEFCTDRLDKNSIFTWASRPPFTPFFPLNVISPPLTCNRIFPPVPLLKFRYYYPSLRVFRIIDNNSNSRTVFFRLTTTSSSRGLIVDFDEKEKRKKEISTRGGGRILGNAEKKAERLTVKRGRKKKGERFFSKCRGKERMTNGSLDSIVPPSPPR